jgi:hypothetical protein
MKRMILAALVGLVVSGPATAYEKGSIGSMLESAERSPRVKKIIELRMYSIYEGMRTMNLLNRRRGLPRHFCSPPKLTFNGALVLNYFSRYLAKVGRMNAPFKQMAVALAKATVETFPCKKEPKK